MIRVALAQLRRRPGRYISLFFAIAVAVALTVATAAISLSLQHTVNNLFAKPYQDTAAVVMVRGNQDDIQRTIDVSCTQPGVTDCSYDRLLQVAMRGESGVYQSVFLQAIDEHMQWREVEAGQLPVGPGEAATADPTVPLGSQASVAVPGQAYDHVVTIVGHVEPSARERLMGADTLFVSPAAFVDWGIGGGAGELRVAAPAEQATTIVDNIKQQLPDTQVVAGKAWIKDQANQYLGSRDRYFLLLQLFTLTVAAVAALVIVSAFSVVAGSRRREFALLKSIGATRTQLYGSVSTEAILLGLIGGVIGAPAGLWLAGIAGRNADKLGIRVPLENVHLDPVAMVLVGIAGVLVTVAAALPAARGAIRSDVVSSLTANAANGRGSAAATTAGIIVGVLLMVCGIGANTVFSFSGQKAIAVAVGAGALIILGLVFIVAALLPRLVALVAPLARALPTVQIGLAFVGRQLGRAGAIAGIIVAGTALIASVLAGQSTISEHLNAKAQGQSSSDVTVSSLEGPLPEELIGQLAATPTVGSLVAPSVVPVSLPGNDRPADKAYVLSRDEAAASFRGTGGALPGELVLSKYSSLRGKAKDGDTFTIEIMRTPVTATVRYSEGTNTFIDPALIPDLGVPLPPATTAFMQLEGPAVQAANNEGLRAVEDTIRANGARVSLAERFTARQDILDSTDRILTLSTLMTVIAALVAAVGVTNTVILAVRERARDHQLLRSVGMTRGKLSAALLVELTALSLPSSLIGVLAGGVVGHSVATTVTGTNGSTASALAQSATLFAAVVAIAIVGVATIGLFVSLLRHRED
ncbi:ABC transporter permease [Corynebacterium aquilae]|uniref:ABC3 transporter permease C-terminal domain-containing protein n=1 Tax=Corynebacterium aquilae DSM 44791 TaxID=1431546 RepID=A0A1L7CIM0_9CORY|nr:ABC transporter permease [Corynebacterium aquilae]APT85655.1 hypothetical protein CAQU_12075 [Corynebacterium aquilae DSM 44791]